MSQAAVNAQQTTETAPAQPTVSKQLVETIASAVVAANRQIQKDEGERPFETRMPSLTSVFNPEGLKVRPKLKRNYIFCCDEQDEKKLTNEEIHLFNQLKPGRYGPGRKWEVIEREDPAGERNLVEIRIPVSTQDERMELAYSGGGSLKSILSKIIEEAAERAKAPVAKQQ